MARRYFSLLVFLFAVTGVYAQQFPSEVWHEGMIVLIQGDSLWGNIKYNQETDIVQFTRDNKTINTYTPRKLLFFEIFDEISSAYRQFYSLPYQVKPNFETQILFEVLYEGPLTLLSRESIQYQTTNNPYSFAGTYTRLILVYTYFFLDLKGNISKYSGKKSELYPIFKRKQAEIKNFVRENKLRHDRRKDLIQIVAYYNSLVS